MVIFYKKFKKYNEIQLTKNKLEQSKNEKSSALPRTWNGRNKKNIYTHLLTITIIFSFLTITSAIAAY